MVDKNRRASSGRSSDTDSSAPAYGDASAERRPFWWQADSDRISRHQEPDDDEAPGGWAGEPADEQGSGAGPDPQQVPFASTAQTVSSLPAVSLQNVAPVSAVLLTFVPVDPNAPVPTPATELPAGTYTQEADSVSLAPSVSAFDENQNPNANWAAAGSDQISFSEFVERLSLTSATNMYEPLRTEQQLQLNAARAAQPSPPAASPGITLEQLFPRFPRSARGDFETASTRSGQQQLRARLQPTSYSVQNSPASDSRFVRPPPGQLQQMRFSSLQSVTPAGASAGGAATPTLGSLRASLEHLRVDPAQLATGVPLVRVSLSSTHSSTSSSLNIAGIGPEPTHFAAATPPAAPTQNHEAAAVAARHSPVPQTPWTPAPSIAERPESSLNNLNELPEGVAYVPIFPYYMQTEQFKYASIFSHSASHPIPPLTFCLCLESKLNSASSTYCTSTRTVYLQCTYV